MAAKSISLDTHLQTALKGIQSSEAESRAFVADPKGYLKSKGVDTAGLNFGHSVRALPTADATVCGSVGCVVCGSVG